MVKTKDYYSLILIVWCMKLKLMLMKTLAKIKCLILVIIQVNLHSFAIKLFTVKKIFWMWCSAIFKKQEYWLRTYGHKKIL